MSTQELLSDESEVVRALADVLATLDGEDLLSVAILSASFYAVRADLTPRAVYDLLFKVDAGDEKWRELIAG